MHLKNTMSLILISILAAASACQHGLDAPPADSADEDEPEEEIGNECAELVPDPGTPLKGAAQVRINEFLWWDDGSYDWVELYNFDGEPADMSYWTLTDEGGYGSEKAFVFTPKTRLDSGEFRVLHRHDGPGDRYSEYPFGLESWDALHLYDEQGELVDSYAWQNLPTNEVMGRYPDGGGDMTHLPCATAGSFNHEPIGDEECQQSDNCARYGMCSAWDGRCWKAAATAEECAQPMEGECESVCSCFGHCSLFEDRLCMALSVADCETAYGQGGCSGDYHCDVIDGYCLRCWDDD